MLNMQSFFPRCGGKSKLANRIVSLLPEHTIYCEPFVGAGSVLLRKPVSKVEVINDNDEDVYHLWIDFQNHTELINEYTFDITRDEFTKMLDSNPTEAKDRLYRNLVLSKFSFSGNRKNYAPCVKTSCVSLRRNWRKYQDRLRDLVILKGDYKDCIHKYDSDTTIFYLDPPYESGSLFNWDYTPLIRAELREVLRNIQGKFVMSYEYSTDICEYFKEFNQSFLETHYSSGNRSKQPTKKKELILTNFK